MPKLDLKLKHDLSLVQRKRYREITAVTLELYIRVFIL